MQEPGVSLKSNTRGVMNGGWPRAVRATLLLCLALHGMVASAHDFWLEVTPRGRDLGPVRDVTIRNGTLFSGDSIPRVDHWFTRFVVVNPYGSETQAAGVIGDDPAATFKPTQPGTYTVIYSSTSSYSEMDGARFTRYLENEGLERIRTLRAQRGESDAVAREDYYRHAKALVAVGSGPLEDAPRGLELELVLADDSPQGHWFALYFRGEPLPDVRVVLMRQGHERVVAQAQTDGDGRVLLATSPPGYYLVKAVHAVPAPPGSGLTQWISYWASLTFEVAAKN